MAEKIKAITDPVIIREARAICGKESLWTPDHQRKLIWNLFRTPLAEGGCLVPVPDKDGKGKEQAVKNWLALWDNGRLAYPSNTARSLAEGGHCAKPITAETVSVDGMK